MNDKTFGPYLASALASDRSASELMNQIISVAKDNTINFDPRSQVYYKLLQLEKHLNNYLDKHRLTMAAPFWYNKENGSVNTITYGAIHRKVKNCLDRSEKDVQYKLTPADASLIGQLAKTTLFKYDASSNPDTKDYSKLFEKFKYFYMGAPPELGNGGIDSNIVTEVNSKDSINE